MILVHNNCPKQTNSEGRGQVPGDIPHIWYPKTQSQNRQYLMQLGLDYRNEVTKQMTTFYWMFTVPVKPSVMGTTLREGQALKLRECQVMEDTKG